MNTPQSPLATLLGGVEIEVKKLDGSTEKVRVRQLPVKLYPQYLQSMQDEPKMIELLCDKPEGWSDGLALAEFGRISEAGEELNRDFFDWFKRNRKRQEQLAPGLMERVATLVSKVGS